MIVYSVILLLMITFLIFIIAPLRMKVIYQRKGQNDYAGVELYLLWNLLPLRIEITSLKGPRRMFGPFLKIRAKITSKFKKPVSTRKQSFSPGKLYRIVKRNSYYLKLFSPVLKDMGKKSKILKFRWETKLGFENAASTGIATGGLWTLKGLFSATLYQVFGKHEEIPKINIHPVYNEKIFDTEIDCIFEVRPGHIIINILKMIKIWLSNRMNPGSELYARSTPN